MKPILTCLLFVLCASCLRTTGPENTGSHTDTEFYIPVENSELYVRLVGNPEGPVVINLHGGPGAFSGFDHIFNEKFLEEDYLFVYLDQRGSGKSLPCTDSTMLNMEQFVEDLDVVVDSISARYEGKPVNLIGSSWGGTLGLLYMISHQEKINSYACVSGKADGVYPINALIEHERELAVRLLEKAEDPAEQKRYREVLARLEEIEKTDLDKFYEEVNTLKHDIPEALGFNVYWANKEALAKAAELGEDSAYYAGAHYTRAEFDTAMVKFDYVNRVFRNSAAYNNLNIIDELAVIRKPVLVIQGEFDYSVGVKQAEMIYNGLEGVPEQAKKLHIVPNAAHNLNLEAQDEYYRTVHSFFDEHNVAMTP